MYYIDNREGKGPDRKEKGMEDMGMSDLQFKSFLKQLVKRLEDAAASDEEMAEKVKDIIQDLKSDIES